MKEPEEVAFDDADRPVKVPVLEAKPDRSMAGFLRRYGVIGSNGYVDLLLLAVASGLIAITVHILAHLPPLYP